MALLSSLLDVGGPETIPPLRRWCGDKVFQRLRTGTTAAVDPGSPGSPRMAGGHAANEEMTNLPSDLRDLGGTETIPPLHQWCGDEKVFRRLRMMVNTA